MTTLRRFLSWVASELDAVEDRATGSLGDRRIAERRLRERRAA
jgi:hypothetical protein